MKKNSAQVKLKDQGPKDPHIWIGLTFPLPSTGNPVMLQYREAFKALDVIGEAIQSMKLSEMERKHLGYVMEDLVAAFTRARQNDGGIGLPLKLSRIWPDFNDDGTRKDENAPSPKTSAKMGEDQGQAAKA